MLVNKKEEYFMKRMFKYSAILLFLLLSPQLARPQSTIANHLCTGITKIPIQWIDSAKANLHIAYGHTSHGSQVTDGMLGLVDFANGGGKGLNLPINIFEWNDGGIGGALDLKDGAMGGDVGYYPQWVDNTRSYLGTQDINGRGSNHPEVNVIIWSWCGQVSSQTEQSMIERYLAPMTKLESDYPNIKFVYMTGHLDGSGLTGNLHLRNEQIREYCRDSSKILFDFADIECYDPDGAYYGDKHPTDGCTYDANGDSITSETEEPDLPIEGSGDKNWAVDWQNSHTLNVDWYYCGAAHSQALNANQKAYAIWWLWARLAGWNGGDGIDTLEVNPASLSFGDVVIGSASNVKTYLITGSNLTPEADTITITAPAGFAISANSDTEFVSSMKIAYTGGILSAQTIYVKFLPIEALNYTSSIINIGGGASDQIVSVSGYGISVNDVKKEGIGRTFELCQNFPNPFNPQTVISYKLSAISDVSLKIFDILGREIATLVNGIQYAGEHKVEWNGKNSAGKLVGSGMYFYKLKSSNGFVSVKKMLLVK